MRRHLPFLTVTTLLLAGCSRLSTIPYDPPQTPESWLTIQPVAEWQLGGSTILIVQPSTSAIVYLLGIITILAGIAVWRIRQGQRSRGWWALALLLWGVGALLAGTSYEAFSYQIKCAGRALCSWTSWWEIFYLIVSAGSVDAMLIAQAYASNQGSWRKQLIWIAPLKFSLYLAIVLVGAFTANKFLVSFELLLLAAGPNILFFLIQNGSRYRRQRRRLDLLLLRTWVWLVLTIAAYFLYLISGLTGTLWEQGIWFSENDVLHIGLIIWMVYIAAALAPALRDEPPPPLPGANGSQAD